MQVTRENAECNNNNKLQEKVGSLQRPKALSESWPKRRRKEGRKEGRTMTNDDQWTIFRKPRKPVNERHLSVPTLPNNWNVFKFPYLIPVSYFRIVRRYRMSHLKGKSEVGVSSEALFYLTKSSSLSSCIRILYTYCISISYFTITVVWCPTWQSTWSSPSPDESFGRCAALAGVAVLCGQWSQLWTKPGPVPCLCFWWDLQIWAPLPVLVPNGSTNREDEHMWLSMWSIYMSTTSQSEIHLLDLLCSCTMDGTSIMPTGFVESTEVWGTQSCRSAVLALVLKGQ